MYEFEVGALGFNVGIWGNHKIRIWGGGLRASTYEFEEPHWGIGLRVSTYGFGGDTNMNLGWGLKASTCGLGRTQTWNLGWGA